MQCTTCGKENQAATRFCIHCGAAQASTPDTPGATTVIAAMAQAGTQARPAVAPPWVQPAAGAVTGSDAEAGTPGGPATARAAPSTSPAPAARLMPGDESVITPPRQPPAAAAPPVTQGVVFSDATSFTAPRAERAAPPVAAPSSEAPMYTPSPDPPASAALAASAAPPLGADERTFDTRAVEPHSSMPPPPPMEPHDAAGVPPPPAYDAAPRRNGVLVVIGLAVLALLGIGGFFVYQVSQDRERTAIAKDSASASDSSTAAPAKDLTAPVRAADQAPPPSAAANESLASAPVTAVAPEPPPATPQPAVTAPTAPPTRAGTPALEPSETSRPAPRAPARTPAPRPPVAVAPAPPPVVAPAEPVAPPAPPPARVAPPPARPVADRWAQMQDELQRCRGEDFIKRVVCDQRVRLRYCDGYWGKVQQCPGAPQPDRGQ